MHTRSSHFSVRYCRFFTGWCPKDSDKLQHVMKAAARLITNTGICEYRLSTVTHHTWYQIDCKSTRAIPAWRTGAQVSAQTGFQVFQRVLYTVVNLLTAYQPSRDLQSSDQQLLAFDRTLSLCGLFQRFAVLNILPPLIGTACRSTFEPVTPSVLLRINSGLIVLNMVLISSHIITCLSDRSAFSYL